MFWSSLHKVVQLSGPLPSLFSDKHPLFYHTLHKLALNKILSATKKKAYRLTGWQRNVNNKKMTKNKWTNSFSSWGQADPETHFVDERAFLADTKNDMHCCRQTKSESLVRLC